MDFSSVHSSKRGFVRQDGFVLRLVIGEYAVGSWSQSESGADAAQFEDEEKEYASNNHRGCATSGWWHYHGVAGDQCGDHAEGQHHDFSYGIRRDIRRERVLRRPLPETLSQLKIIASLKFLFVAILLAEAVLLQR